MPDAENVSGGDPFPATSRTLYQRVVSGDAGESGRALEDFYRSYWSPMYVVLRGQGESHHDASDLVQGFIHRELLEREQIENWRPEKGRLRTFLKVALDRYRMKENRRETAAKRGGPEKAFNHLSLDLEWAEGQFAVSAPAGESPDRLFERAWAEATMQETMTALAREYAGKEKGEEFQLLCQHISARAGDGNCLKYEEIAKRLNTSENNVKQKMREFRKGFKRVLECTVGQTTAAEEVEDEVRYVSGLLMGKGAG